MKSYHLLPFGSRWLYLKIYCNPHFANELLLAISDLLEKANMPHMQRWFFIRYHDPDFHLRIRFYHEDTRSTFDTYDCLLPLLSKLLDDDVISRVSLETYQPELARYGGNTAMFFCEKLFCLETECLLKKYKENSENLFLFTHRRIRNYIEKFKLMDSKAFIRNSKKIFDNEFTVSKRSKSQFYRLFQELREDFLLKEDLHDCDKVISSIYENVNNDKDRSQILRALIHMFVNRTYSHGQRKHELLHYWVLDKST